ncbi:MAG: nucleotide-binding protein [Deltaproteobacteria bacterium]|nr:nucleotide-binding protein [Deltaproteobacteria bacterium]
MRDGRDGKRYVFIGHEFTTRGGTKKRFRNAIAKALSRTPYTPLYADDIENRHERVLEDITRKIRGSEFCIFDLTSYKEQGVLGKNLNVILEIGIGIGAGKQAFVAFREKGIDLNTELSDLLGRYWYSYKKYEELIKDIEEFIKSKQSKEGSRKTL